MIQNELSENYLNYNSRNMNNKYIIINIHIRALINKDYN